MLDVIASQSVLPVFRGVAVRPSRTELLVGTAGTLKKSALWGSPANDNGQAWPYVPFPENLLMCEPE
jgi:hypothetical protein